MRIPIFGKKQASRTIFNATGAKQEKSNKTDTNFKEFIEQDPVLNSNLKTLSDAIFEHYPRSKKTKRTVSDNVIDKRNEQLAKVDFGRKIKDNFPSLWHNGDMFFEVIVNGNKLKEFYIIDASTMKVEEDDFGNVTKYIQQQPQGDKELDKDRIFHIKAPSLMTGSLGEPLLKPLEYTLKRKESAENFMAGMIYNLSPLIYIQMQEADDNVAKEIQNEVRRKRKPEDPIKLIALLPDEKVGRVDTGTTADFDAMYRYIDAQNDEIIRVVQIPPIVSGSVDNSNRSNSEVQERAVFGRTVIAWQNFLRNEFRRLFEDMLGWKNVALEFPMVDERKKEAAIVQATKLKDLGYSTKAIHEMLEEEGVKINPDFDEGDTEQLSRDLDNYPSRQPRDKAGIPQNEEERQKDIQNGTKKEVQ